MYQTRDFIITFDGLVFAVTVDGLEDGKVIACLRYVPDGCGLRKIGSGEAADLLSRSFPHYLHYSKRRDVTLQAVPPGRIRKHLTPRQGLAARLAAPDPDPLIRRLAKLTELLVREGLPFHSLGVTGSLLAGTWRRDSDIDLVVYGQESFELARRAIHRLIAKDLLETPSLSVWETTWRRRGCPLSFTEYLWHEQRKFNKGVIDGSKFDLVLVQEGEEEEDPRTWHKQGRITIQAKVSDASKSFANPARYHLDHPAIPLALSFTATYTGQAKVGESVEISGYHERSEDGKQRIVVGSSREAPGEYIKVIHR